MLKPVQASEQSVLSSYYQEKSSETFARNKYEAVLNICIKDGMKMTKSISTLPEVFILFYLSELNNYHKFKEQTLI